MTRPPDRGFALRQIVSVACLAVAFGVLSQAGSQNTLRIWKIGSPHLGDTPPATVPPAFSRKLAQRGVAITVESVSARDFAATFVDAARRNAAPDVIVTDNMGNIKGITVRGERVVGIGEDPAVKKDLIQVTGAFDELLGPQRGWTYLYAGSANYHVGRDWALTAFECARGTWGPPPRTDLAAVVPTFVRAYLEQDAVTLDSYGDAERIGTSGHRDKPVRVGTARPCGAWGNNRLAFVSAAGSYESETAIGYTNVLLVFRNISEGWRLLVAARDPVSNGTFVAHVRAFDALLEKEALAQSMPTTATPLSPPDGQFPVPATSQRFGAFIWKPSAGEDVVAEIAEFAYLDDARLFLQTAPRGGSRRQISTGQLWTTHGPWKWRVWSITRAGDVVISDARSFVH